MRTVWVTVRTCVRVGGGVTVAFPFAMRRLPGTRDVPQMSLRLACNYDAADCLSRANDSP